MTRRYWWGIALLALALTGCPSTGEPVEVPCKAEAAAVALAKTDAEKAAAEEALALCLAAHVLKAGEDAEPLDAQDGDE